MRALTPALTPWWRRLAGTLAEFEVPQRLRAIVRARESGLIAISALVGAIAGLVVAMMGRSVDHLHQLFFGVGPDEHLSGLAMLDPVVAVAVPTVGGLILGTASLLLATRRPAREIDPIEANALHGGRMSLLGSLIVAAQTVWSSGVGASVGLEAGYTQLSAGAASRIGRAFRLRRADLRILVGCGSAGGIAGAFGAPLAGAFYAFELVIGNYSVRSLAPVGISAVIGYLVAGGFAPVEPAVIAPGPASVANEDLAVAAVLGLLAAMFGILIMRGVALGDSLFARLKIHPITRCAIGGFGVGLMAIASPQIMSSGHGALHLAGMLDVTVAMVATMFVLKSLASVLSLAAGFRGGLFFASLLLGALGGRLFATALNAVVAGVHFDTNLYAVIGMGALSASVIGGPCTMIFVVLESTGDLWLAAAVLIAVIVSAQVTRETFGYSFATWRFHLRGETIRSAADVGSIRDLTVGSMMRHDVRTISVEATIAAFREEFPLGSTSQVVAVDARGRYAGLVMIAEAHAAEIAETEFVFRLLRQVEDMLTPSMTLQEALEQFVRSESEVLAVVDSPASRRVLGLLSEAHALRRYLGELELRRRELVGDG